MPVLDYDPKAKLFVYGQEGAKPVRGASGVRTQHGLCWVFPDSYPKSYLALREFTTVNPGVGATPRALERINAVKAVPDILRECPTAEAYADLFARPPYAHQRTALEHIMQYPRLMLLLEQGLGKTFISYMAVALFKAQGIPHKTVVVCPRIVLGNWVREISEYTNLKAFAYYGGPAERAAVRAEIRASEWDVVVTTFDMLIERRETSAHTYSAMWDGLSDDEKTRCLAVWKAVNVLAKQDEALLTETIGGAQNRDAKPETKAHAAKVSAALKRIPPRLLPAAAMRDARREASGEGFLRSLNPDVLFVDEASRCLSVDSARSAAVEALACTAPRTYLLSGTLCVGRPTDLYMPARILDESIFGLDWTRFKLKYCRLSPYNKHIIVGYKNVEDIKLRTDPYILSMSRADCLDMPDRVFIERYYTLSDRQRAVYNAIVEQPKISFGRDDHGVERWACTELTLQKINKLTQCLSGFVLLEDTSGAECGTCQSVLKCADDNTQPGSAECLKRCGSERKSHGRNRRAAEFENGKLDLLREDLESIFGDNPDAKVIIWAWYVYDQTVIARLLDSMKIKYVRASEPECDKRFESDPALRVFLGQTRQGIGITLNAATTTVYYSHGPDLEARLQSLDRNYRIGQRNNVTVHDYVCPGTLEENMLRLLKHKRDVQSFMQQKVGCLYCPELKHCDCDAVEGTAECRYKVRAAVASSKKTLKIKALPAKNIAEIQV